MCYLCVTQSNTISTCITENVACEFSFESSNCCVRRLILALEAISIFLLLLLLNLLENSESILTYFTIQAIYAGPYVSSIFIFASNVQFSLCFPMHNLAPNHLDRQLKMHERESEGETEVASELSHQV